MTERRANIVDLSGRRLYPDARGRVQVLVTSKKEANVLKQGIKHPMGGSVSRAPPEDTPVSDRTSRHSRRDALKCMAYGGAGPVPSSFWRAASSRRWIWRWRLRISQVRHG